MKEEIKKNLDSLKKELDKLAPAIEHLQIADKNATALVNSFKSIHSVYELHLLSIEELLVASNKEHLNQIAKELNASSSKLNSLGDTVSNSFKGLEKDSKQKELIAKIESAENATKQRIDNSEKEFTKMFERVSKENNLLKILLFVSIGLTVGLIIYRIISGT
jgi:NAD-dependent DNA ligase